MISYTFYLPTRTIFLCSARKSSFNQLIFTTNQMFSARKSSLNQLTFTTNQNDSSEKCLLNLESNQKKPLSSIIENKSKPVKQVTDQELEVKSFWKNVWITRLAHGENPNFHNEKVKPYLIEYLCAYSKEQLKTVLVPFCGKSVDMFWLLQHDYHVIGVDLSHQATDDFFREHQLVFQSERQGDFIVKKAKTSTGSLTLFCGDIFKFRQEDFKTIDLVYDRAGYNSIPLELRQSYAQLLTTYLPKGTKVLLGILDFEGQQPKSGPPYFISEEEVSTNLHTLNVTIYAEKRQHYFSSPT